VGCSDESGGEKSAVGESCTKTADCQDGLRCISLTCTKDSADTKQEFSDYLDKYFPAFCAWLGSCKATYTKAECLAELQKEGFMISALNCPYNVDFYQQNKAAMDACLSANPACGGDDLKHHCSILAGVDFEKCKPPIKLDGGGVKLDGGTTPNCIQTTFKVTNWPGSASNNSLYTGTSWELKSCTEIQPDNLTITIKCPKGAFGKARLISEGCGVLGIAAPGNILSDVGAAPSGGYSKCSGQTVSNTTVTCYQECKKLLKFEITNGPCS
jgi:hypothetical protein